MIVFVVAGKCTHAYTIIKRCNETSVLNIQLRILFVVPEISGTTCISFSLIKTDACLAMWSLLVLAEWQIPNFNKVQLFYKSINNTDAIFSSYEIIQTGKLHLVAGYSLNCIHTTPDNILILFVASYSLILIHSCG